MKNGCIFDNKKNVPFFIFIGAVIIFFREKLIPINGEFLGGLDVAYYFYWNAHFVKDQFLSGHLPLWNPHYYCGHPFIANPQTFVFYPATLLFIFLPIQWAFTLDVVLHFILAAAGMYLFVTLLTDSKASGLVSAVVYAFSAYFAANCYMGHLTMIHTAALVPWIFFCTEKGLRQKNIYYFVLAGLVFGCQILAGEPQNNYYTLLFISLYILYRIIFDSPQRKQFKQWRLPLFGGGVLLLVAFCVSAIQILPALEFTTLGDRYQNTYTFSTFLSFPPSDLFRFLLSNPQSAFLTKELESCGYLGIMPLFLAGFGLIFSRHRHVKWCFLLFVFFALTIMFGMYTPLYSIYFKWLPGISFFRVPARAILFFVFSVSILAGLGTHILCQFPLTRKHYLCLHLIVVSAAIIIIIGGVTFKIPFLSKSMIQAFCFVTASLIAFNVVFRFNNRSVTFLSLFAIIFIDLCISNSIFMNSINQDNFGNQKKIEEIFQTDPGFYRVNLTSLMSLRGMKFGYYCMNGYTPMALDRYFRFVHYMANLPIDPERRYDLNPDIFLKEYSFLPELLGVKYSTIKTSAGDLKLRRYQPNRVIPKALLVYESKTFPEYEDHLRHMKYADFNPRKTILLTASAVRSGENKLNVNNGDFEPGDGRVQIKEYKANQIELQSFSREPSYLLLNELYYPGWQAHVDDKKTEILRANYLFRAVFLKPGSHRIQFTYRPLWFYSGAVISLITTMIVLVFFIRNISNQLFSYQYRLF